MEACPDADIAADEDVFCEIDQMTADMHNIVVGDADEFGDEVDEAIDEEMLEEAEPTTDG